MPITPLHRSDILLALLRATCSRDYLLEDDWLAALRPFNYADPGKILRTAIEEKLLVRDYRTGLPYHYCLAHVPLEHFPVPAFHKPAPPASALHPVPRTRKTPPEKVIYPRLWGPEFIPHRCAATRVSYFRAPSLAEVPLPPAPCPALRQLGGVTLAQVYQVVTEAPPRLVSATEVVGQLHGSALAPLVAGVLD